MADNYCESSSFVKVPKNKIEKARLIIERIENELRNDDNEGYVGFTSEITPIPPHNGVWIMGNSDFTPEHTERLVRALVDELNLKGIFVCSWSYSCSKPLIDEFGGGAFAISKDCKTIWIDALSEVQRLASISVKEASVRRGRFRS